MGLFGKNKADSTPPAELEKLHGKRLSRVVERIGAEERVLGGRGGISVIGRELVIVCDGSEVFRCDVKGCIAATLMSGNGCDIRGMSGGRKRHVIAYYSANI